MVAVERWRRRRRKRGGGGRGGGGGREAENLKGVRGLSEIMRVE